jgi:hypothetical protein
MARLNQIRLGLASRNMTHGVQYHRETLDGKSRHWECIALFDVQHAADDYCARCVDNSYGDSKARYRVVKLT